MEVKEVDGGVVEVVKEEASGGEEAPPKTRNGSTMMSMVTLVPNIKIAKCFNHDDIRHLKRDCIKGKKLELRRKEGKGNGK